MTAVHISWLRRRQFDQRLPFTTPLIFWQLQAALHTTRIHTLCCLRLSARSDLMIPRSRLSCYRSHSFTVCGPAAWNSLPAAIQDLSSSSSCFCSHLKTELFAGCMALIHYSTFVMGEHKLSYLLTYSPGLLDCQFGLLVTCWSWSTKLNKWMNEL